jgi:hypothetical protein
MAEREVRQRKESTMATDRKRRPPAALDRRHLDDLLDQALAASFPASDPVALDFESPGDRRIEEERAK